MTLLPLSEFSNLSRIETRFTDPIHDQLRYYLITTININNSNRDLSRKYGTDIWEIWER